MSNRQIEKLNFETLNDTASSAPIRNNRSEVKRSVASNRVLGNLICAGNSAEYGH